ncbi:thermosome subunit [archaeon]|nr:thermosome subunit [archaeon]|tara:strand:- start:261 stop:1901 length:1641 start_codon:yes stop_codon:yes gene_type:complete
MTQQMQPIFILPENTQRTTGKDAQRNNIAAAKAVAETVRTTLGPKGMDKMIVDSLGDVIVTNDGVTILKEVQVEHPAAKMIVEIAKTQEEEVGDGTTTAVVLTGELLKNAEQLLDKEVHSTIISKGYRLAATKAKDVIEKMAETVSEKDEDILTKIALTAMTGKGAELAKEKLAKLLVEAVSQVQEGGQVDLTDIKIEKKVGNGAEDSELIKGIIIDKERVHSAMPKNVKNAKVALLDTALEIKDTETDAKIQINDPTQLQAFAEQEEKIIRDLADKVIQSGANVVIAQKGIDDMAQYFLAKEGIYAVRRVKKSDMEKLAKATGARIVSNLNELSKDDLGETGFVEEIKVGDEDMTYVKECKNPKAVTLLIRGGTQHVVDEIERSLNDALGDIVVSLKSTKVLGGAGAPEVETARELRAYANKLRGREKLAVLAFAEAMEVIPRTLSENAGLDPIDKLTDLSAKHEKGHKWAGIDVFTGKVIDAWQEGIIEPAKIKTQAIKSAVEVVELILRIDDVISTSGTGAGAPPPMPPGGMGGMGGMPEGMM